MMFVSLGIGAVLAIVLITVVSFLTGGTVTTPTAKSALIGTTVPAFHTTDLTGAPVRSPFSSGHPTVLVFLASWCTVCRQELPALSVYLHQHPVGPVRVLGVDYLDDPKKALALVRSTGFGAPVIADSGTLTQNLFHFAGLPDTVFIDHTGHVVAANSGTTSTALFARDLALLR